MYDICMHCSKLSVCMYLGHGLRVGERVRKLSDAARFENLSHGARSVGCDCRRRPHYGHHTDALKEGTPCAALTTAVGTACLTGIVVTHVGYVGLSS